MKKGIVVCAALCSVASAAYAQDVFYWPAPAAYSGNQRMLSFPAGTPLSLATRTEITTKNATVGQRVFLSVAENLTYRGQIVIPVGAPVAAEIIQSDANGHFGKKGKLAINLLYVQTPSGPVRLYGETTKQGKSGTLASVATMALASPLGFLIHGTSATIPYGTPVQAYLAQPLTFAVQANQTPAQESAPTQTASVQPDP